MGIISLLGMMISSGTILPFYILGIITIQERWIPINCLVDHNWVVQTMSESRKIWDIWTQKSDILEMEVSWNGGTPTSSIETGCFVIFPYKPSIFWYSCLWKPTDLYGGFSGAFAQRRRASCGLAWSAPELSQWWKVSPGLKPGEISVSRVGKQIW